ncbi:MAG: hypothetical protein ACON3Z_05465 [Bradymonadia bacterium]
MTWWRLFLVVGLLGCGAAEEETKLQGSVGRVYSLEHDSVRALLSANELAVQFIDDGAVIVQVVLDRTRVSEITPGNYDLATDGLVVGSREDRPLPDFVSGTLELTQFAPDDGASISGEFGATLATDENNYSVYGRFDTTLTIVP